MCYRFCKLCSCDLTQISSKCLLFGSQASPTRNNVQKHFLPCIYWSFCKCYIKIINQHTGKLLCISKWNYAPLMFQYRMWKLIDIASPNISVHDNHSADQIRFLRYKKLHRSLCKFWDQLGINPIILCRIDVDPWIFVMSLLSQPIVKDVYNCPPFVYGSSPI